MSENKEFSQLATVVNDELGAVLERMDEAQVQAFIDELKDANRIFVAGVGREGLAARGFAMRLMHMGFPTYWAWDDTTPGVQPGDVFLMINGSGEIGHLQYMARKAVEAGGKLVQVSAVPPKPDLLQPERALVVPAAVYLGEGDLVESVQPMGNLFEQSLFVTFDIIVQMMMSQLETDGEEMEKRHRNFE